MKGPWKEKKIIHVDKLKLVKQFNSEYGLFISVQCVLNFGAMCCVYLDSTLARQSRDRRLLTIDRAQKANVVALFRGTVSSRNRTRVS